ncbi:hypothetical protein PITCH_A1700015 [uncultured Desulfobacterium sp.]|uniref:Uncharacterized protein n=1 Tax=uncultured Desulfobacterium sp. TaxID=201089 RepID=A0A445MUR5_9BACT|nr:hypothetical protein PITCH_A1700015 [uncultured Desulfobacterium sp.]
MTHKISPNIFTLLSVAKIRQDTLKKTTAKRYEI